VKPYLVQRLSNSRFRKIASEPCLDLSLTCNLCRKLHAPEKCKARFYSCCKCGEMRPLCQLCYRPR
jgi:hypothetical protein